MTFELFVDEIVRGVAAAFGSEYHVTTRKVPKNNGVVLTGLLIGRMEHCVTPVIYLDSFYEAYKASEGSVKLEEMVKLIAAGYQDCRQEAGKLCSEFDGLLNYETIKDKIIYKLVNTEEKLELLNQVPSSAFHDLSIVFMLYFGESEEKIFTALIHNEHMALWNVTVRELYEAAERNTPRLLPETFTGINEMIRELLRSDDESAEGIEEGPSPFYILTNRVGVAGAACMIYPGVIKKYADQLNSDLLILPSSTHETLLLPYEDTLDVDELREMVQQINASEVAEEDRLSEQIYLYRRLEDRIIVAV